MAGSIEALVLRVRAGAATLVPDRLAVERALEIRARMNGETRVISTTMRTPGEDRALAVGFLFAERVITSPDYLATVEEIDEDTVLVEFAAPYVKAAEAALASTARLFITSGACGVCGRSDMDALMKLPPGPRPDPHRPRIAAAIVGRLPAALQKAQATFAQTGGLHAAGLFSNDGVLHALHEDVGRHNAVDKLVGTLLLDGALGSPSFPAASLADRILVVSGRASFELVQKAAVAGFPAMAAVGAPSSLAVELARKAGITLMGFVRSTGFNVYCGAQRLDGIDTALNTPVASSSAP